MKLLFDQNLSHRLAKQLAVEFPESRHVRDVDLSSSSDPEIWTFAAVGGFAIVSKDTDFQQRAILYGAPPKVIWLRLGNCSTEAVAAVLRHYRQNIVEFLTDSTASFLVLS